ncbi:MAG: FAD-dependent oxidoreductase [Paracoccaceae bacterium]
MKQGIEDPRKDHGEKGSTGRRARSWPIWKRTVRPRQEFDTVISTAVGIVGNVEGLGLEAGESDRRTHVVTDEYCRTGVEGLYAIGDIAGAPKRPQGQRRRGGGASRATPPSDQAEFDHGCTSPPSAGRLGRPDRSGGQGSRIRDQGRPFPFIGNGKAIALGEAEG